MEKIPPHFSIEDRPRPDQLTKREWEDRLNAEIKQVSNQAENILFTAEEKEDRVSFDTESFLLYGRHVSFFGVKHTAETFARYEKELRQGVKEADFVVFEGAPEIQLGERSMAERIAERQGPDLKAKSVRDIRQGFMHQLGTDGFDHFYHAMENVAALEGKKVALFDPMNLSGATKDENYAYLKAWERELPENIEQAASALAVVGLASHAAGTAISKNEKLSRRGFLMGAGTAVAGISALAVGSQMTRVDLDNPEGKIRHMSNVRRKSEQVVAYGLVDFRNILIAERLELLVKTLPEGAKISVFYGDGHRAAIQDYLTHPVARVVKKQAYKLAKGYMSPKAAVGAWKFDFEKGKWEEQSEGEIFKKEV